MTDTTYHFFLTSTKNRSYFYKQQTGKKFAKKVSEIQ